MCTFIGGLPALACAFALNAIARQTHGKKRIPRARTAYRTQQPGMGCLCDYAPYTDTQKTPVVGKRVENNSIKLNDYIPWGCFSGEILRHTRLCLSAGCSTALLHGARVHGCWWITTTIIIIINIISTTNPPSTSLTWIGAVVWVMCHRRRSGPYMMMMMMMIIQQRRRVDYESALCFVCVWLILLSLMHSRLLFVQVAVFYWETRSVQQQCAAACQHPRECVMWSEQRNWTDDECYTG